MLWINRCYDYLRHRLALPKPDLPFAQDDAGKFLPWIIACMVCLTALLLAAALSINQLVEASSNSYSNTLTIQIPNPAKDSRDDVNKVMNILSATQGISNVNILENDKLRQMVSPWLGGEVSLDKLPLPTVIDATFDDSVLNFDGLRMALSKSVPTAKLQEPELWVEKFSSFNSAVRAVAICLALLLIVTTVGMVVLSAKTALKLHHDIVTLLHSIGAKDAYIARQFQINAFALTLKGAAAGTMVAAFIFSMFIWITQGMESPLLPDMRWSWSHIITFIILPFATAGIALYVAHKTVFAELEAMP